jgi:flagellar hook-length control protein FliK
MPTPEPIAVPTPASRNTGLLKPTEVTGPVGSGTPGFTGMLTALLPPVPVPSPGSDGQPISVQPDRPVATPLGPVDPKTPVANAKSGRTIKQRPLSEEPAARMPTTSSNLVPTDGPPMPAILQSDANIRQSNKPALPTGGQTLAHSRPATAHVNEAPSLETVTAPSSAAAAHLQPPIEAGMPSVVSHQPVADPASVAVLESVPTKITSPDIETQPAEQLAPILVTLANDPTCPKHLTLQLQPDGLGSLLIRIEHQPDTPIHIRVEAERPETLALLQRDIPQLQRALDRAGVVRETMTLTFHAVPVVASAPTAQDAGHTSSQFLGTGQPHQGFGEGRPQRMPTLRSGTANETVSSVVTAGPLRNPMHSGIDITA